MRDNTLKYLKERFIKMEENMMTIENENEFEIAEAIDGDFEFSDKPNYGVIGAVGALIIGGIAAIAYKNRHKFEEHQIKKLRKKGYEVYKIEEACDSVEADSEVEETEE
jgi:hypothetical protein